MDREKKEKGMRKKGWVSYRMSPRREHQKRLIVEITAERSAFSTTRHFPCNFSGQLLFSRESKLDLDIPKKTWESRHFRRQGSLGKLVWIKGFFFSEKGYF